MRFSSTAIMVVFLVILVACCATGTIIEVYPDDEGGIQAAIDSSSNGDMILIHSGLYDGDIVVPSGRAVSGSGVVHLSNASIRLDGDAIHLSNLSMEGIGGGTVWNPLTCLEATGMGITIVNISIEGCYRGVHGVDLLSSTIENVRVSNTTFGLQFFDPYNLYLSHIAVQRAIETGIIVQGSFSTIDISNTTVADARTGIQVGSTTSHGTYVSLSDISVHNTTWIGINLVRNIFVNSIQYRHINISRVIVDGLEGEPTSFFSLFGVRIGAADNVSIHELTVGNVTGCQSCNNIHGLYVEWVGSISLVETKIIGMSSNRNHVGLIGVVIRNTTRATLENITIRNLLVQLEMNPCNASYQNHRAGFLASHLDNLYLRGMAISSTACNGITIEHSGSARIDSISGFALTTDLSKFIMVMNTSSVQLTNLFSMQHLFPESTTLPQGILVWDCHEVIISRIHVVSLYVEFTVSGCQDVFMDDLSMTGPSVWVDFIHVTDTGSLRINGVDCIGGSYCINVYGSVDTRTSISNVSCTSVRYCITNSDKGKSTISLSSIESKGVGGRVGIQIIGVLVGSVRVDDVSILGGLFGLMVTGSKTIVMEDITVVGSTHGVVVMYCQDVSIDNLKLHNTDKPFRVSWSNVDLSNIDVKGSPSPIIVSDTENIEVRTLSSNGVVLASMWVHDPEVNIDNLSWSHGSSDALKLISREYALKKITLINSNLNGDGSHIGIRKIGGRINLSVIDSSIDGFDGGVKWTGPGDFDMFRSRIHGGSRGVYIQDSGGDVKITDSTFVDQPVSLEMKGIMTFLVTNTTIESLVKGVITYGDIADVDVNHNYWKGYSGLDLGGDGRIATDGIGDTNLPFLGLDWNPRIIDGDKDGYPDQIDAFPNDPSEWSDSDDDGIGDNADDFPEDHRFQADSDGDGVPDRTDLHPLNPNLARDLDGDFVDDSMDAYPDDPTQYRDSDGDGHGDNMTGLRGDMFPDDPNEWSDADGDGVGDNGDIAVNIHNTALSILSATYILLILIYARWRVGVIT